ncbi:MAG: beta-eliminating lyase-related protein [Pseudomonadota bacterium]
MSFGSDNWAGMSEDVLETLREANAGAAPAYGADPWTGRALDLLRTFFERDVTAIFVSTGSAANALALASHHKPGGVTLCHVDAHIVRDEAGAPNLFAHGLQIDTLDGPMGRIEAGALGDRLATFPDGVVFHGRPTAVSITNVNEIGQCYGPSEIAAIAAVAKARGAALHMDGARFLNAVATLGVSPAALTWRAGVDVLSLGLTKTGGLAAEAVVFFDDRLREDVLFRQKQAAQLFSKNRFAAAQFVALLSNAHGLDLARHANAAGARIAQILEASPDAAPIARPAANMVFAHVTQRGLAALDAAGIVTAPWSTRSQLTPANPFHDGGLRRFAASFLTDDAALTALERALAHASGPQTAGRALA